MNSGVLIRVCCSVLVLGLFLYAYINKQNQITQLRLHIPTLSQELEVLNQENTRLQFEVDQFESPQHLMELARKPQFSHLKFPSTDEIVTIRVPKEER